MDYLSLIQKNREDFDKKKIDFTKKEINYLIGRDTFRGRFYGFLTFAYCRRPRLVKEGFLTYGLTIRIYRDSFLDNKPISTWVLFSPLSEFDKDPLMLLDVKDNLDKFVEKGIKHTKYKKLFIALTGELSEPQYLEIPKEFSNGKLVYLSYVELREGRIPQYRVGVNLILMNQKISKEIMYLPSIYWSDEYSKQYNKK